MKGLGKITGAMCLAGAIMAGIGGSAAAEYPERGITLIVPFGAGGGTDIVMRVFGPELGEVLGTDVIVKNVSGGGGAVGLNTVAQAKPDGYTIGAATVSPITTLLALQDLPYTQDSFDYICRLYGNPMMLMVAADSEFDSLEELLNAVRNNPGEYAYTSSGPGSLLHVVTEALLAEAGGLRMKHLPVKSSAEMVKNVLAGTVHVVVEQPSVLANYELRPLALYADERLEDYPNVPTMRELGYDMPEAFNFAGMIAPAGLPEEIHTRLINACETVATESEDFKSHMEKINTNLIYQQGPEFREYVREQKNQSAKVLKSVGMID